MRGVRCARGLCHSVAAADANADAGNFNADAAAPLVLIITPAPPIVSVGLPGFTDDDTAITMFAPAAAVFPADQADILCVAIRSDQDVGGQGCRGSSSHKQCTGADRQRDHETLH